MVVDTHGRADAAEGRDALDGPRRRHKMGTTRAPSSATSRSSASNRIARTFKLSPNPFFVEKVRDIAGLYLNPPDKALVLCVDEKSQIQALERTQPNLPLGLGYVEGMTHDYTRHGTTTLFAALDIATGKVIADCQRRHRHQEFLAFLSELEANVPGTWTSI